MTKIAPWLSIRDTAIATRINNHPAWTCRWEIGRHYVDVIGSVHALHRIDDRVLTWFGMKADVIAGSDQGVERRAPHRRILAKLG